MKKRLWLGIIVAMLMLSMTGLAAMAETPMVLDQYVTSSANPYNLEMLYFSYTPEEDGYYIFKATNYGADQDILLDDEGNTLAYGQLYNNKSLLYPLKAGETYHLWIKGMAATSAMVSRYTDRIWVLEGENYSLPSGDRMVLTADAISTTGSPLSYSWYRVNGTERVKLPSVQPSYSIPVVASECVYICEVTDGTETKEVFWEINIMDDSFRTVAVGDQEKYPESDSDSITMEVDAQCAMGDLSYQWYRSEYVREGEESHEVRVPLTGETAASLTIWGPYEEFAEYVCEVSGQREGHVFAKQEVWFFVHPYTDFTLTAAEQNVIMTPGESVTLEVALEGNTDGVVLDWAYYDSAWDYIPIEGEHGTTMTVSAPPSRYTTYECMAIREADGTSCTVSINVEFQSLLQATHDTSSYTETRDMDPVTMSVSATTDGGVLSYQWYQIRYDNASGYQILIPMEGANGASFVETTVTGGVQRTYRCVVGNGYIGTSLDFYVLHSNSATYTPSFSVYPDSPSSVIVDRGGSTEMRTRTENAQGTVRYQWLQRQGRSLIPVSGANNSSYTATDIQHEMDYYCQATDSGSSISGSAAFHISIATPTDLQAAAASAQERTVEPEMQTELSVSATGGMGTIQYEWYEKKYDLENEVWVTTEVSGVTGNTYTPTIDRESVFTCVVSDDMAYQQIPFTVHLDSGLTAEAATDTYRTVALHDSVTLAVSAASSQNRAIHYEWIRTENGDGENQFIEGVNGSSYTISDVSASGNYTCRVSDGYTMIPIRFNLQVDNQFDISREGEYSRSVPVGQSVTLTVNVSALDTSKIRYEWWSYNISGILSDTDTLTLESVTTSGYYYVNVHDDISARSSTLYYYVSVDSGLTAQADGETQISAEPGMSVTMKVNASHETSDDIQYKWYHLEVDPEYGFALYVEKQAGLSNVFTSDSVVPGNWWCQVSDLYMSTSVYFTISIDSGLTAEAVGETNITVEAGTTVTLTVNASHNTVDDIQYRWYHNEYIPEVGYEYFEDQNGSANSLTALPSGSGSWYCEVSDSYMSMTVYYHIGIDSKLTAEAVGETNITVEAGTPVTLQVNASHLSDDDIQYMWYHYEYNSETGNDEYVEDQNGVSDTLIIADPISTEYYCEVRDIYLSQKLSFTIQADSGLFAEPADGMNTSILAAMGEAVELAVFASHDVPDGFRYQWYRSEYIEDWNGWYYQPIEGATESHLTITNPDKRDYYCRVWDRYMHQDVYFSIRVDSHLTASFDQKDPVVVRPNDSVTLNITAQSDLTDVFTYQWSCERYNPEYGYEWVDTGSVTGAEFTIENVNTTYSVSVNVSDGYLETSCSIMIEMDSGLIAEPDGAVIFPINDGPVTLAVHAENALAEPTFSYQWYDDSWGQTIYETGEAYTIENPTTGGYSCRRYSCRVSDGYAEKVVYFYLVESPYVTSYGEQQYKYVIPDENVTLRVLAWNPQGDITYQWYLNDEEDTEVDGATSDTYSFTAERHQNIYCHVYGTGIDTNVWFYIHIRSEFDVNEPETRFYEIPMNGSLELVADITSKLDDNLTFIWTKDGKEIPGETGNTIIVTEPGEYRAEAYDRYGESTSLEYTCIVEEPATITPGVMIENAGLYQFVPNKSGFYRIDTNAGVNIYCQGQYYACEYVYPDGDPVFLYAGKTYYLTLQDGNYISFTLHKSEEYEITIRQDQNIEIPPMIRYGSYYSCNEASSSASNIVQTYNSNMKARRAGTADVTVKYDIGQRLYHVTVVSGETMKLPSGLQTIEEDAFNGNTAISAVEIGGNVFIVKRGAFANIGDVNVVVEGYSTTFEDGVFAGSNPTVICPNGSEAAAYCERQGIPYFYPY